MVPFFVWWGHWKGDFGGGWSLRGVHPKKYTCRPKSHKKIPPGAYIFLYDVACIFYMMLHAFF